MSHVPYTATVKKKTDWATALAAYLQCYQKTDFQYGINDCCVFVGGAIKAMTDCDLMAPYYTRYKDIDSIQKIVGDEKAPCLTALIRRTLQEWGFTLRPVPFATRGDIVLMDEGALGLVDLNGRHIKALDEHGHLSVMPMARARFIWTCEEV
jgi:hypothetical protein